MKKHDMKESMREFFSVLGMKADALDTASEEIIEEFERFVLLFQGVMKKDLRRELGAHYTDLDNILKLLNPLFLDNLW